MSDRTVVIANWKMNHGVLETIRFLTRLAACSDFASDLEVIVAPPTTNLYSAGVAMQDSFIKMAAQNCYWKDSGAFTGESSPQVLSELGCEYVLLGHSERRKIFNETSEEIGKKVNAVLGHNMQAVLCVGETIEEKNDNQTMAVIEGQLRAGLEGVGEEQTKNLIIAYEPVWAIGTGKNATPDQAEEVHLQIRELVGSHFSLSGSDVVPILYGGSVKPDNIAGFMNKPNINGALVGGASLEVESFIGLLNNASV